MSTNKETVDNSTAPEKWESNVRLGDLCSIKHGHPFRSEYMTTEEDDDLPIVVNIGNFRYDGGFRFESTKTQRYTHDYPKGYELEPGDILLVMTCQTPRGEILGIPGRIPDDGRTYLHNQRMGLVVPKEGHGVTLDFLYWLFLYPSFNHHLFATSTGAKILHTAPERIEGFTFSLPPVSTRRKISSILGAYEESMDNNQRRMRTLEGIAKSVYEEWFVRYRFPGHDKAGMVDSELGPIPDGWETVRFEDILSCLESGSRPKGGIDPNERDVPSIGAENILGLGRYDYSKEKYVSQDFFQKMRRGKIESGDVLLYKDGANLGRKSMFGDGFPHDKCCINEHVFILRTNERCSQEYLYFWLDLPWMTSRIRGLNANAAQPGINQKDVKSLPILLIPKEVMEQFAIISNGLISEIFDLAKKNRILLQIRDLLIPRLISGKIDATSLDIEVPEEIR